MTKVLIVDDAMFMRNALKMILKKHGFEVVGEASSGLEAISRYEELKPDIVTMDIHMPEMGGVEAITLIVDKNPDAKIVIISAAGDEGHIVDALKAGAKNFIVKPFTEDKVIEVMKKL